MAVNQPVLYQGHLRNSQANGQSNGAKWQVNGGEMAGNWQSDGASAYAHDIPLQRQTPFLRKDNYCGYNRK